MLVFMSASRAHQTSARSNLAGNDDHGYASFFSTEKVYNLPKLYPQTKKNNSSYEKNERSDHFQIRKEQLPNDRFFNKFCK